MQLIKSIVCLLALVTKTCFAGSIIDPLKSDESLVDASVAILESCYIDRLSNLGLAGPSAGSILEKILSRNIVIPSILIDETSKLVEGGPVNRGSRYKLQAFVLTASDPTTLAKTITQVKNSKWWNHLANFLLINWPEVENGCSNAYELLWEAWKMNLLKTNLMCFHRTRGLLIYTFNPYTNKAPFPWQHENSYKGINDHEWTLYSREYRGDVSPCHALDFDKTLDLGGYEIRASIEGTETWWYDNPAMKPAISSRVYNITAYILMSSLNAKWKLLLEPKYGGSPRDKKGNPIGVAAMAVNGTSDICLNPLNLHVWKNYEITYPIYSLNMAVITQYRGHKSQLDKLISVLDRRSRYCLLVVILTTFLFFKYHLRETSTAAILNLLLLICNAALRRTPDKLASRIYLGCLFILVVTIQGIYQGKLASLLTKPVRLSTIDSVDDLARSDHTIYGTDVWRPFFNQSTLIGRYVESPNRDCTDYVLRDSKAACAGGKLHLISEAVKFDLHVSEKPMGTVSGVYLIRPNWPLEERVNDIYGRAMAGDLTRPRYIVELQSAINALESYKNEDRDQELKPLTLKQLRFAFVILAIGLACATITFIVEVIYGRAIANNRGRVQRRIAWIA